MAWSATATARSRATCGCAGPRRCTRSASAPIRPAGRTASSPRASASGSLIALALLFVPICFGLGHLYPWAAGGTPSDEHLAHVLAHKQPYLNGTFYIVRAVVIFVLFAVVVLVLRRTSLRQDHDGDI